MSVMRLKWTGPIERKLGNWRSGPSNPNGRWVWAWTYPLFKRDAGTSKLARPAQSPHGTGRWRALVRYGSHRNYYSKHLDGGLAITVLFPYVPALWDIRYTRIPDLVRTYRNIDTTCCWPEFCPACCASASSTEMRRIKDSIEIRTQ